MKVHHWITIIVGILIVGALIALPNINKDVKAPVNEVVGVWLKEGVNSEGQEWWMRYEINNDGTYTLTTDSGYGEDGTYEIGERYLDGSLEFIKTYLDGEKTHTMIIVTTDNPNIIKIEGVELQRVQE